VTVSAIATVYTSAMPTVTTSPALTRFANEAPKREVCQTVARTARNDASMRIFVIVRCRAIPSSAFITVTASRTRAQPTRSVVLPATRPSSTARDSTHGGTVKPTVQQVPSTAPNTIRRGCDRVSQYRNRIGLARSPATGGVHVSAIRSFQPWRK
jgi:hypothetical protein